VLYKARQGRRMRAHNCNAVPSASPVPNQARYSPKEETKSKSQQHYLATCSASYAISPPSTRRRSCMWEALSHCLSSACGGCVGTQQTSAAPHAGAAQRPCSDARGSVSKERGPLERMADEPVAASPRMSEEIQDTAKSKIAIHLKRPSSGVASRRSSACEFGSRSYRSAHTHTHTLCRLQALLAQMQVARTHAHTHAGPHRCRHRT
jgi:hypothetical protein